MPINSAEPLSEIEILEQAQTVISEFKKQGFTYLVYSNTVGNVYGSTEDRPDGGTDSYYLIDSPEALNAAKESIMAGFTY